MSAAPIDLERARRIVGDCVQNVLAREGVAASAPSLAGYSLAELVEANRLVREANAAEDAKPRDGSPRTTHVVCDDRLIAALYVAHSYEAEDPVECRPLALGRQQARDLSRRGAPVGGVFVIDMAFYDDGGIADRRARSDVEAAEEGWDPEYESQFTEWCPGCFREPIPTALANQGRRCRSCEGQIVQALMARSVAVRSQAVGYLHA